MRTVIAAIALCFGLSAIAQQLPQGPPADKISEAGMHIEKAGKQRTTAQIVTIGTSVLVAGMLAATDGDTDRQMPVFVLGGAGFLVGTVIHFGANSHEKRAGRIMQGKP